MIFSGSPALPSRKRRTRVFPKDPVPPVIRIRLPSKQCCFELFPFCIAGVIDCQIRYKLRPRGTNQTGRSHEFASFHAPIAEKIRVGSDLNVELVCILEQAKKVVFGNSGTGDLVEAAQSRMFADQLFHNSSQVVGGDAAEHRAGKTGNVFVVLTEKPFKECFVMREFPAYY